MAKRQKEKLIEEIQFQDVERAQRTVARAKSKQIRILIGLGLALIATILALIGMFGNAENGTVYLGFGWMLAVPAYLIGGGIKNVLKLAWKITKIGWFIIPVFPADFLIAFLCFVFSIFGLLCIPVIFVGINYMQHQKTLDAAISYLAQCGYAVDSTTTQK